MRSVGFAKPPIGLRRDGVTIDTALQECSLDAVDDAKFRIDVTVEPGCRKIEVGEFLKKRRTISRRDR